MGGCAFADNNYHLKWLMLERVSWSLYFCSTLNEATQKKHLVMVTGINDQ
jgi:hypothetical protein